MSRERRSQASRLPKTAGFISPSIACESRVAYFCPCDIGVIPHEQRYQALCRYAVLVYLSSLCVCFFLSLCYEFLTKCESHVVCSFVWGLMDRVLTRRLCTRACSCVAL